MYHNDRIVHARRFSRAAGLGCSGMGRRAGFGDRGRVPLVKGTKTFGMGRPQRLALPNDDFPGLMLDIKFTTAIEATGRYLVLNELTAARGATRNPKLTWV